VEIPVVRVGHREYHARVNPSTGFKTRAAAQARGGDDSSDSRSPPRRIDIGRWVCGVILVCVAVSLVICLFPPWRLEGPGREPIHHLYIGRSFLFAPPDPPMKPASAGVVIDAMQLLTDILTVVALGATVIIAIAGLRLAIYVWRGKPEPQEEPEKPPEENKWPWLE